MNNAINNIGNSTPFDMGNMSDMATAAQSGTQTNMSVSSVRMFSPDDAGGMGHAQPPMAGAGQPVEHARHAHHAAMNGGDAAAQGGDATQAGNAAQQGAGNGSGAGMSGMLGQIMNMLQAVISAAAPLISMFSSMMGGAGSGGAGAGGTGAA